LTCICKKERDYAGAANTVVSYTVVMLPAALFLLALASVASGAFPMDDVNLLVYLMQALALTLLVFCALGVLIALYCDSESTAFLTSLVIGLPLLFMSGLLFPFEFMPSLAAEVGIASPLTQGMLAMQSAVTYGSPSDFHLHALALYGVIVTLMAAAKNAMHSGQGK